MQLGLAFILLSLPLIELAVLIKAGQVLGFWPTILLLMVSGIGGTLLIQRQGFAALNRMMEAMRGGRPPLEAAAESALIVFAGVLLIVPGFITDVFGLLLLVPPVRRGVAHYMLGRMDMYVEVRTSGPDPRSEPRPRPFNDDGSGVVIEGEYERVDDPARSKPPGTQTGDRPKRSD